MLKQFLAKARARTPIPSLNLPEQPPEIEALLADIQAHSELAARAALADDWESVYRHRHEAQVAAKALCAPRGAK